MGTRGRAVGGIGVLAGMLLAGAAHAPPLQGQEGAGVTVRGRVLVGPDSVPAAGAVLTMEGLESVRTDDDGSFVLAGAPAGAVRVMTVLIPGAGSGATTSTARFRIPPRQERPFVWWVASPGDAPGLELAAELDAVTVRVRATEPSKRNRPDRRDVLDREEIAALEFGAKDVGDVVRQFLGVRVLPTGDPAALCIVPSRRSVDRSSLRPANPSPCPGMVTVVVDGMVVRQAEYVLPTLEPEEIERIEYIGTAAAGLRYGRGGALVIRTRTR